MLSMLIPVFQTDINQLVISLHGQATLLQIPFEIIALDDGSSKEWTLRNKSIEQLRNCTYHVETNNRGRSATRNTLAQLAQYECLLFLDADTLPASPDFLSTYLRLKSLYPNARALYGACIYPPLPESKKYLLHWMYGTKVENPSVKIRSEKPYRYFHTVNFMTDKTTMLEIPFDEKIKSYGYEDSVWASRLEARQWPIVHIENPVVHTGIHNATQFLRNQVAAVRNFIRLHRQGFVLDGDLNRAMRWIDSLLLRRVMYWIYYKLEKHVIHKLLSDKPPLKLVSVFKLGMCLRFWNKD